MLYILDSLRKNKELDITSEMRENLDKVLGLFSNFLEVKTGTENGWKDLFVLVLMVRAMISMSCVYFSSLHVYDTPVKYNEPYQAGLGSSLQDETGLETFLDNIPQKIDNGPQISIYYPQHNHFHGYHCFLVSWNERGIQNKLIGYRLQEGGLETLPDTTCPRIHLSYAVGLPTANDDYMVCGWFVPATYFHEKFYGPSGQHWTLKAWKSLMSEHPM